jgi:putative ABC transport system permease protein
MVTGSLVTPGYFRALGIRILRGRDLAPADDERASRVAVVSETFAERFWPGEDALGKRLQVGSQWWSVVGVVPDVKQVRLYDAPEPQFYRPHAQDPWPDLTFAVRVRGGAPTAAARLAPEIRRTVREVDPSVPVYTVRTMAAIVRNSIAAQRLYGALFAGFAAVALLLATAGIYGVTAYYVSRRTPEIGIRMALGAERRRIVRLVMSQGAVTVGLGLALGLVGALVAARALARVLYGVRPDAPLLYAGIAALLGLTALAALYVPARRAAAVDPMVALRAE